MLLTLTAIQKINELCQDDNEGLRIQLLPGGCSGTYYHFTISKVEENDIVFNFEQNIKVYLDSATSLLLQGSTIDYKQTLKPPRFRVLKNPNTPLKCPCGRSFGNPYPGKVTPDCKAYTRMVWD